MRSLILIKVIGLLICQSISVAAKSFDYSIYTNSRFGFSVRVPKSSEAEPESSNGDGRKFTTDGGQLKVTAWGDNNVFDQTSRERYQELIDELRQGKRVILSKTVSLNSYSVVWISGDKVSRQRSTVGSGKWSSVLVEYPNSQKSTFESVAKAICASLTPPKGG